MEKQKLEVLNTYKQLLNYKPMASMNYFDSHEKNIVNFISTSRG